MLQVLSDQGNLGAVRWVVGNDLLYAASVCHLENVGRLAQVKGHYVLARVVYGGLPVVGRRGDPASPIEGGKAQAE